MFRLRLSDREQIDPSMPADWRYASPILASLFANFGFWHAIGAETWVFGPLPLYLLVNAAAALLIPLLFFAGPALAVQSSGRPLFDVVGRSLGSIPAAAVRLCGICFLALWIAILLTIPFALWQNNVRLGISQWQAAVLTASVLTFLFVTGLQSLRTTARLASFTNKLGLAILVAAIIRVRDGLPAVEEVLWGSSGAEVGPSLTILSFWVAPLAFLGAHFAHRGPNRKHVALTGLFGIALPLLGAILLVGIIHPAQYASVPFPPLFLL